MSRLRIGLTAHLFALALGACGKSDDVGEYGNSGVDTHIPIEDVVGAPVTVDELDLALSRDYPPDIEYATNEVKRSRLSYDVSRMIACAYVKCSTRNKDWHPVIYENDLIRVNFLDVLVQAKCQSIDHSIGVDFREDTIGFLGSENPFVVRRALLVLAHAGDERDIERIEAEALAAQDDTTFRVAVLALKLMSIDQADDAIRRALDAVDKHRRSVVEDLIE